LASMREAAKDSNVRVMDRDSLVVDGVRFLGTTMWTDFQLPVQQSDGTMQTDVGRALEEANRRFNDFRVIDLKFVEGLDSVSMRSRERRRPLQAADTLAMHWVSRDWLRRELAMPFEGTTVVVTHHAPSSGSVAGRYASDWLTPAFVTELPSS